MAVDSICVVITANYCAISKCHCRAKSRAVYIEEKNVCTYKRIWTCGGKQPTSTDSVSKRLKMFTKKSSSFGVGSQITEYFPCNRNELRSSRQLCVRVPHWALIRSKQFSVVRCQGSFQQLFRNAVLLRVCL